MSLPRTPPKFSSDTNIPTSVESDNRALINTRKRKQPDNYEFQLFEEKFNKQLSLWDQRVADCVTSAVSNALTAELVKVTSVLEEINNNMIKLNADNCNINKCLSQTNKRLDDMEKSLNYLSERQTDFDSHMKAVEITKTNIDNLNTQICSLEQKVSAIEQQARQCNIEISNVPERRGENLLNMLETLGNVINQPIRSDNVVAVHRVPHADSNNQRPKNIIVKLSSRMLRDNIIAASRKLRDLDSSNVVRLQKRWSISIYGLSMVQFWQEKQIRLPVLAIRYSYDINKIK
ncbi:hypothetical protein ACJJTC_008987 [Scirpophaga incertulas]